MIAGASDLASATVVVFNSADPASEALAKYYAERRHIDPQHLVGLRCSLAEEISRSEYENSIARPLREIFLQKGWWRAQGGRIVETRVRLVALIRGIPFKISSQGTVAPQPGQAEPIASRDEASVDSELAALATNAATGSGLIPNPYYRSLVRVRELVTETGLLLVCRLDAPSEATVRRMIDNALAAEMGGLWGWAYVDSRSIRSGGYAEGDNWLTAVANDMRSAGIPVLLEKSPETLASGFPVTDAVVYYGWYASSVCGPFADQDFRFKPGAIAVHVHSFSASRLRDPFAGWCGPLLERGAAVTLGTVYEPYLALTAHLDVFQSRLMKGFTLAESAYMSMPALSWMNVVLGDPLYRPYLALEQQDIPSEHGSIWQRYRSIVLAAGGNVTNATPQLRQAGEQTSSSIFLESLAAVQADAGDGDSAKQTIDRALALEAKPPVRLRLILAKAGLLKASGNEAEAAELIKSHDGERREPFQSQVLEAISEPTSTRIPSR